MKTIGINEALILAALSAIENLAISDIAARLAPYREVDDGTIYVALQRMIDRGFVTRKQSRAKSTDGRERDIAFYGITGAGSRVLAQFEAEASQVPKIRLAVRPA